MVYLAEIEHCCSRAYGSQIRLGCITKACLGFVVSPLQSAREMLPLAGVVSPVGQTVHV
jgi:hypothetical protein